MNRSVALHAFCALVIVTVLAAFTGMASQAHIAEALLLIGASLSAAMLILSGTTPAPKPVPVRARRRR